jgi:anaerobic selenocysteine-containing dehydrogenase
MSKNHMDVKYSSCCFCSSRGCAVKVYVENNRVRRVTVDTEAPVVPGAHCPRPSLSVEYQESPFRLDYPLKRTGVRGANRWEQITWHQALDEIAARLSDIRDSYGAEALATSSGTGRGALRAPQHGLALHLRRRPGPRQYSGKDETHDPLGAQPP